MVSDQVLGRLTVLEVLLQPQTVWDHLLQVVLLLMVWDHLHQPLPLMDHLLLLLDQSLLLVLSPLDLEVLSPPDLVSIQHLSSLVV